MNSRLCLSLAACALSAAASSGCSSLAPAVVRAQSPAYQDAFVMPTTHGHQPHLWDATHDHMQGSDVSHYRYEPGQLPYSTGTQETYYDPNAQSYQPGAPVHYGDHGAAAAQPTVESAPAADGPPAGACPADAACPYCKGCPPDGTSCPICKGDCRFDSLFGGSQGGHTHDGLLGHGKLLAGDHQYPQHRYNYSYHRPRNLAYPPPNLPGGAVIYPYYTHKGPSCFFRQ
jgi:hypothetical protein